MQNSDINIDVTKNLRIIESLKSELLTQVAGLFESLTDGYSKDLNDIIVDEISSVILVSYLLSRRLGLDYIDIDRKIQSKIRLGLIENSDVERYYGDLSELGKYFNTSLNG